MTAAKLSGRAGVMSCDVKREYPVVTTERAVHHNLEGAGLAEGGGERRQLQVCSSGRLDQARQKRTKITREYIGRK
jgi:hypothetical protein